MRIHTFWTRQEDSLPEPIEVQSEYCRDDKPDWWAKRTAELKSTYSPARFAELDIDVDDTNIKAVLSGNVYTKGAQPTASGNVVVLVLFIQRRGTYTGQYAPEPLTAVTSDILSEGLTIGELWDDECRRELAVFSPDEVIASASIPIEVPRAAIDGAFGVPTVTGTVHV